MRSCSRKLLTAAALISLVLMALPGLAVTWNAAAGFSDSSNPNGVWSYGFTPSLGGTFASYATNRLEGNCSVWGPADGNIPWVFKNVCECTSDGQWGGYYGPGQLGMHAGAGNDKGVLRWTASEASIVRVTARFRGANFAYPNGASADVHVLHNSASVYDDTVQGFAGEGTPHPTVGPRPDVSYSAVLVIAADDTIDLAAGSLDGSAAYDLLAVDANIEEVAAVIGKITSNLPGNPAVAGATVQVGGGTYTTTTDANGDYFLYAPAGDYTIEASKAGYVSASDSVTLVEGEQATKNLVLTAGLIKGTITAAGLGYGLRANVAAGSFSTTSASSGYYELPVPPGSYTLEVTCAGYDPASAPVTVASGGMQTADLSLYRQDLRTYDLGRDFSQGANPEGVWAYGLLPAAGGAFTPYDTLDTSDPSVFYWCQAGGIGVTGAFMKSQLNRGLGAYASYWATQAAAIHPPQSGLATARWTAPVTGTIVVDSMFTGVVTTTRDGEGNVVVPGTTTDVHVIKNGTPLFDGHVNGYAGQNWFVWADAYGPSQVQSYKNVISVSQGDIIDFAIGCDGAYAYDMTGTWATVYYTNDTGYIEGKVVADTPASTPVLGAVVSIKNSEWDDTDLYWVNTDAAGAFRLPAPAGTYLVQAAYATDGYSGATSPLRALSEKVSVTVTSGATTAMDFRLKSAVNNTHYVDGLTGDDMYGSGGEYSPWKTIDNPSALIYPGDVVIVRPGTYTPTTDNPSLGVELLVSGQFLAPVTYRADSSGPVIIEQSVTGTPWCFGLFMNAPHVVADGFEIVGGQNGVHINASNWDNRVTNCVIHGQRAADPVAGPGFDGTCSGIFNWMDARCSIIDRNIVYDIGQPGQIGWAAGISSAATYLTTICNNTITDAFHGFYMHTNSGDSKSTFRNNIIADISGVGLYLENNCWAGTLTHSNNLFSNCAGGNWGGLATPGASEIALNPAFVDAGNPGRIGSQLTESSPAVDAGVYVGIAYNGNAPDLGALESTFTAAPAHITGKVITGPNSYRPGVALSGVVVKTTDNVYTGITDTNGDYSLTVVPGSYTVRVALTGAITQDKPAAPAAGQSLTVNFGLDVDPSYGRTFYVNSETGDDASDGATELTAWKTLERTNGAVTAHDTVLVSGTFIPTTSMGVAVWGAGNALSPVVFKADGKAVIQQNIVNTPWCFGLIVQGSYAVFDGFEVIGGQMGVYINDVRRDDTIKNCIIHGQRPATVAGGGWDGTCAGVWNWYNATGNAIHHNAIYDVGVAGQVGWAAGVHIAQGGSKVKVHNNTFDGMWFGVYIWNCNPDSANEAVNNIFTNVLDAMHVQGPPGYEGMLLHNNNLFYAITDGNPYGWLAQPGANEATADPMFVNAAARDYRVRVGSPAIDAGVILGYGHIGSFPDLGAFEGAVAEIPTDVTSISDAKQVADGKSVNFTVPVVATASSTTFTDGSYYVEDELRSNGIRVKPGAGVAAVSMGDRITFTGVMGTENGERFITITQITSQSAGVELGPLGVGAKSVYSGVPTTGLLVRVWGVVQDKQADYMYLEDGGMTSDGGSFTGVRVKLSGLSAPITAAISDGKHVAVTGLVSGTPAAPVILPRGDADVTVID